MNLQIDPELRRCIPPLSPEELAGLEADILEAGRVRIPLDVWGNIIIDGHNRYEIATRHNIPFEINRLEFENKTLAKIWMRKNQLHRRNLTDGWRIELVLQNKADLAVIGKNNQGKRTDLLENSHNILSFDDKMLEPHNTQQTLAQQAEMSIGKFAQGEWLMNNEPELFEQVKNGNDTVGGAYKKAKQNNKQQALEAKKAEYKAKARNNIIIPPTIQRQDYSDFLDGIKSKSVDLLLTDPPFSTDIDDIVSFANDWVLSALSKIKDTGRGYICIGAYPIEIKTYLDIFLAQDRFILDAPLVWTYRNTLGQTPKYKYNLNYQMILHFYSNHSPSLDTSITNEMFSVQDITAPDGRHGNRLHKWQKPDELALRFIRHSTKENDLIIDPFCGSGTFLIAASKLKRVAIGSDIDKEAIKLCRERGCNVIE